MGSSNSPGDTIRERLLTEHRATIDGVLDAAIAVTEALELNGQTATRRTITEPFSAVLEHRGHQREFPAMITTTADAAHLSLPAPPVPAPPYVTVTGRGPILRVAGPNRRVVVLIKAFELVDDSEAEYRLLRADPEDALDVSIVE